jgi:hypothetical protein
MFSGVGGANSPKQRFENLVNAIHWPSHVTRLPKNASFPFLIAIQPLIPCFQLGENQSLKKADEWRRLLHITPVLLWWTWKDENDDILDSSPPIPANAKQIPNHSRNCKQLYDAILLLCAGVRMLASRTISMAQARIGQDFLIQYCRRCIALGINLVINHHLAMHYYDMIKRFGPVYGWWLFAFERFNGMLEKVNLNGHDGGRMEVTLLRNWVQTHLLYELLLSLPDDAHELEHKILNQIIKDEGKRGGMVTQIAILRGEASAGM